MGIQWGERPYLYRTVDSGAIYKYQAPGAQYYFLSLNCKKILANYFVNTFVFH